MFGLVNIRISEVVEGGRPVTKNLVRGQKMVLGPFFAAINGPRTRITLQNLVHVAKFGPPVYCT